MKKKNNVGVIITENCLVYELSELKDIKNKVKLQCLLCISTFFI